MQRLLNPLLFLMANTPDAEKNLEIIMSMVAAVCESVKNIKTGLESFHANILKMANAGSPNTGTEKEQEKPPAQ